jgi:hypothetical protein
MALTWTASSGVLTNNKLTKVLQYQAQPLLKFRQFVWLKEAFGKNKGESVNWDKIANVATIGGRLVETSSMHETSQAVTKGTLTVDELGNSIPFTYKIETLSEPQVTEFIRRGLMQDMAKVVDAEVQAQFNVTPLRYVGTSASGYALTTNGTATATNTSAFNTYHFKNMADELRNRLVPGFMKADGDLVCLCSVKAYRGIKDSIEGLNAYTEMGIKKVWAGEVGVYDGVRVVMDTWASQNTISTTNRTATARTWPAASLSMDAYMFGEGTVREAVAVPEEIRVKVPTDYGRSQGMAWYMLAGWKIEWDDAPNARIIKWDSAGAA